MKKMLKKALKGFNLLNPIKSVRSNLTGFTLVELIVVIAIIAILSTVGFVSYTGYIRDSRNSVRQSDLSEAVNVVTQFIAQQGSPLRCDNGTANGAPGTSAAPVICYFGKNTDVIVASNPNIPAGTKAAGLSAHGVFDADWAKLNVQKTPTDPKKVYYAYATDGSNFEIYAVNEETTGFTSIVKGSKDDLQLIDGTNSINLPTTVPTGGTKCDADTGWIANPKVKLGSFCVPYNFSI